MLYQQWRTLYRSRLPAPDWGTKYLTWKIKERLRLLPRLSSVWPWLEGGEIWADLLNDQRVPDRGEEEDQGQDGDPQLIVRLRAQVCVVTEALLQREVEARIHLQSFLSIFNLFFLFTNINCNLDKLDTITPEIQHIFILSFVRQFRYYWFH